MDTWEEIKESYINGNRTDCISKMKRMNKKRMVEIVIDGIDESLIEVSTDQSIENLTILRKLLGRIRD